MFAKVFTQIFDSSIADDWQVRHVFEDLLKLSTPQGIVDITPEAIARRTRVPLKVVKRAIVELEKPDPRSRSPECQGRRIIRLDDHRDWGWKIVNFRRYWESASVQMLRMAEAERKAEYRRRHGNPPSNNFPLPNREKEAEGERDPSRTCPGHVPDKDDHHPPLLELQSTETKSFRSMEVAWPSWREWCGACQMAGIPEFYALDHWNRQEAANPPWGKVGNWRAYVACVKGYWVKDGSPLQPTVKGNGAQSIFELKTVMAEKERLAVDLKDRYSSQGAMGATWSDQTKREDYRKLRSEIKGLQARIASMG